MNHSKRCEDGSGKNIHDFYEMYFDPALTANHGSYSQEISDNVIDMQELFGESFPVPKHPITEPPCYIAWRDSTGFIHKRELIKSGGTETAGASTAGTNAMVHCILQLL